MQTKGALIGVGVDIVDIADIQKARFKARLAEYFLSPQEIRMVPKGSKTAQHLASRFALKEAVIKAFPEKLSPFDFKIIKKGKRPSVSFFSSKRNKTYSIFVSLTHTARITAAIAVISKTH